MTAVDWEKPRAFCAESGASSSRWNQEGWGGGGAGGGGGGAGGVNDYVQTLARGYRRFQPFQTNINMAAVDVGTEAA